jgi:hypothetical protein
VDGPGYSAANLTVDRVFYSNQPTAVLPLRLMQVREIIFKPQAVIGPYATVRTATASLDGADLTCVLIAHNAGAPAAAGGRRWEEEEWCVDAKAGTLITFSEAPGLYVHYDYSKALAFHDKAIPNGFTIRESGETIIEARTESVADPMPNPDAFQTTGLNRIGVGAAMSLTPAKFRMMLPGSGPGTQIVTLHAMQSATGEISDVEVLASSDGSLNSTAAAFAQGGGWGPNSQEGATPQSHELVMVLRYAGSRGTTPQ